MGLYVVLNFEDRAGDTTQVGAADSTVKGLKNRYEVLKRPGRIKRLFVGANRVMEHRCVDLVGGTVRFLNDSATLTGIRNDCRAAEKIYLVMHGDPRTPNVCYTNDPTSIGVTQLCTFADMARFLEKVLPAKCRLALVMCYGARAARYRRSEVDHSSHISPDDLKTSFAYQLFRSLVTSTVNARLTAGTGKIQHEASTGHALIEHEDMIDENMDQAIAMKAQTDSKGPLLAEFNALRGNQTEIDKAVKARRTNPALPVVTKYDQYAKNLITWENSGGTQMKKAITDAQAAKQSQLQTIKGNNEEEMMTKYGKFIYTYKAGVLRIMTKYGKRGDAAMKPMTVLYEGQLL